MCLFKNLQKGEIVNKEQNYLDQMSHYFKWFMWSLQLNPFKNIQKIFFSCWHFTQNVSGEGSEIKMFGKISAQKALVQDKKQVVKINLHNKFFCFTYKLRKHFVFKVTLKKK